MGSSWRQAPVFTATENNGEAGDWPLGVANDVMCISPHLVMSPI